MLICIMYIQKLFGFLLCCEQLNQNQSTKEKKKHQVLFSATQLIPTCIIIATEVLYLGRGEVFTGR